MRKMFVTEHQKYVSSTRSGAGADGVYKSKWVHYEAMLFIRNTIDSDSTTTNFVEESQNNEDAPIIEEASPEEEAALAASFGAQNRQDENSSPPVLSAEASFDPLASAEPEKQPEKVEETPPSKREKLGCTPVSTSQRNLKRKSLSREDNTSQASEVLKECAAVLKNVGSEQNDQTSHFLQSIGFDLRSLDRKSHLFYTLIS